MTRIQLTDDVMRCFEEAAAVLASKPGTPIDLAVLSSVLLEVGEAICVQLERNRRDLLARHERLEQMIESSPGCAVNSASSRP